MAETREVESFLALADELHFGRTAERLRVSTAQVSQTIRKLERRIGAPLFTRTSRHVELTAVGRQLLADLAPAWSAVEAALARAVEAGRGVTGTLRVAFGDAAGGQLLAGVAELFRRRAPGCEVEFREVRPAEVLPWLREGEVDVVLAGLPLDAPGLVTGPVLVRETRFLAVAAGHPFAGRDAVAVADLARVTVLRCALPDPWLDVHAPGRAAGAAHAGRRGCGRAAGRRPHPALLPATGRRLRPTRRRAPARVGSRLAGRLRDGPGARVRGGRGGPGARTGLTTVPSRTTRAPTRTTRRKLHLAPCRPPGYASRPPGYACRPPGYASRPSGYASRPSGYASRPPGYASRSVCEPVSPATSASPPAGRWRSP